MLIIWIERLLSKLKFKLNTLVILIKKRLNADKLTRLENIKIPANFDYSKLESMSLEAREKLNKIQPVTISQASQS